MAMWLRRPPSRRQLQIVAVVIVIGLVLAALEGAGLWPEWATAERGLGRAVRVLGH
jgi:hypothetical protein